MKLSKVVIMGFRSIKKTEVLFVDEKITTLIGANDHGKSNILEAILCLNDDRHFTEEEDRNWDLPENDDIRIQWHFTLSAEELKWLQEETDNTEEEETDNTEEEETDNTEEEETDNIEEETESLLPKNPDNELIFDREGIGNPVKVLSVPVDMVASSEAKLLRLRPRIELFVPPQTNLLDIVNASLLATPEYEFMQGIFRLAGIWDKRDSIFQQNPRTSKILNEASECLTKVLTDKWQQGKNLKWKLIHSGSNGDHIAIHIQDPAVNDRYIRPSLRSSGFRTYFLLSMIIYARTENNQANSFIYLFDEPGTYLHPHAQIDLLRSLEVIADNAQIMYTTHSLFLINKNHPMRNRVINKTEEGTKIDQKPFLKNWKAVRDSLGILMSNNFLIAEKTLLVEGPSDVIYIHEAIKRLKGSKKIDIDLNDMSIVDAGTSENYIAMAKLMLSEGREIVALIDGDKAGKDIQRKLEKVCQKEIEEKKLQILPLDDDKSIEDICTDIDVLRKAIQNLSEYLVREEIREYKQEFDINAEIGSIKPAKGKTLGTIIDETTKMWFNPKEKLSKLHIAMEYESLVKDHDVNINSEVITLIEKFKKLLNLRGERAVEEGIFAEV